MPLHIIWGAKEFCVAIGQGAVKIQIYRDPCTGPKEIFRLKSVPRMYIGTKCILQLLELQLSDYISRARHLPFS